MIYFNSIDEILATARFQPKFNIKTKKFSPQPLPDLASLKRTAPPENEVWRGHKYSIFDLLTEDCY